MNEEMNSNNTFKNKVETVAIAKWLKCRIVAMKYASSNSSRTIMFTFELITLGKG